MSSASKRERGYSRDVGIEYYHKICNFKEKQKPRLIPTGSSSRSDGDDAGVPYNSQINTELMCREIPREFDKYYNQIRILKNLLAETRASFDEINRYGYFEFEDQESPLRVIENEDFGIAETSTKPPCIVILGQDNIAKATVVRELFGEELIPMSKVDEDLELQRVVKFSYGRKQDCSISQIIRTNSVCSDCTTSHDEISLESCKDSEDWAKTSQTSLAGNNGSKKSSTASIPPNSFKSTLRKQLILRSDDRLNQEMALAVLEVQLPHAILRGGGEMLVGPCNNPFLTTTEFFSRHVSEVFPMVIYALSCDQLGAEDIRELQTIRELRPNLPVFFIKAFDDNSYELTESARDELAQIVKHQLIDLGFLQTHDDKSVIVLENENEDSPFSNARTLGESLDILKPTHALSRGKFESMKVEVCSVFVDSISEIEQFVNFLTKSLRSHLSNLATLLHNTHTYVLKNFVATAYDLSRDHQITPRRIQYTRKKEIELFTSLMHLANTHQNEVRAIIYETVHRSRDEIIREASEFTLTRSESVSSYVETRNYRTQIENLVVKKIDKKINEKLHESVNQLAEKYNGVLERCLKALEGPPMAARRMTMQANEDFLEINEKSALNALRNILNSAYSVELPKQDENVDNSGSLNFLEKIRELVSTITFKGPSNKVISSDWKASIANKMVSSINETKLARNACQLFKSRLQEAHEQFVTALKHLEANQVSKLEKNESCRMQVRKNLAPKIARLAMEAISLRDGSLYGMPKLDGEIGRGQYGVVYACQNGWGPWPSVAVKSMLPPDEKHWNDLSMEYYYTRSLPPHERIVQIRGSVIDHNYGGGLGQVAALLIMDRYPRDLYSAIKAKLPYADSLQVALDVVDGLRFLHSQGLVHRDIKLKNILLDERNRGKITDLGFCKPEAMMSGSIVGTPIHMGPELLRSNYDHSVDTYAFGILFWYICAGTVKLPRNFEQCTSKEHLWQVVQRGIRPEKLSTFQEECWEIMSDCWATNPKHRPYLGSIRPKLENLVNAAFQKQTEGNPETVGTRPRSTTANFNTQIPTMMY